MYLKEISLIFRVRIVIFGSNSLVMKFLLVLCVVLLIPLSSCNKAELTEEASSSSLDCKATTKAVVRKQSLNENGSEFFYYLAVDTNIGGSNLVFPSYLDPNYRVDGKQLEIRYNTTSLKHTFVVCVAGHNFDPNNPDEQTMPVVNVCKASATL